MSDFDFDALRDPVAPDPDARQRAGVDARARQLRGRARRSRLLAGAAAVVAVAAIATGVVAATRSTDHTITIQGPGTTTVPPSTTPRRANENRFVPPTRLENGRVVLPVTLPNGETLTLRYPPAMKVAQLGFAGGVNVNYPVTDGELRCCGKQIRITYQTVADVYGDATPVHVYDGPNGEPVYYFHSSQARKSVVPPLDFLVFQFGPWLVQVYDVQQSGDNELRMTDAQRTTWARNLTGTTDSNGYLLLHAAAPLSLGNTFEGGFGNATGNTLELAAHAYCDQPESDTSVRRRVETEGTRGVSWCEGDLHLSAGAQKYPSSAAGGGEKFVNLATNQLEVDVSGLTAPAAQSSPAVSASWISPDHGWVLEQDGSVAETTDGGARWQRKGSIANPDLDLTKMRFADADHGFALHYPPRGETGQLASTSDGGAQWTTLTTPFSRIADIEVARGVVYVVAMDTSNLAFKIWSSPVARLSWTEDPLEVSVGAGPIPTAQLVFSGNQGWLVVNNRGVAGAARLGADSRWATWAPPCSDLGPHELAASSAADLFAVCDDGVHVSHNGGRTFTRHVTSLHGTVASPYPNRAVVVFGNEVQRTTDDGVTWKLATRLPVNADLPPAEIGFTDTMQGFVIVADQMFMTRDAGASWQPVKLP